MTWHSAPTLDTPRVLASGYISEKDGSFHMSGGSGGGKATVDVLTLDPGATFERSVVPDLPKSMNWSV